MVYQKVLYLLHPCQLLKGDWIVSGVVNIICLYVTVINRMVSVFLYLNSLDLQPFLLPRYFILFHFISLHFNLSVFRLGYIYIYEPFGLGRFATGTHSQRPLFVRTRPLRGFACIIYYNTLRFAPRFLINYMYGIKLYPIGKSVSLLVIQ